MKIVPTIALTLSLFAYGSVAALASTHSGGSTHAAAMAKLAPADEYFGPLKMSILGIGNALNNVKRRMSGGDMGDDTLASLAQVRNSIADWEHKYPSDPWLSRTLLALHKTYAVFPDQRAHACAVEMAAWLVAKYPTSREAAFVRTKPATAISETTGDDAR